MVRKHLLGSVKRAIMVQGESILIKAALNLGQGKRHEATTLVGYGRNTLSRKIQELGI
jgi:DNA-binding NtrC family response regulator